MFSLLISAAALAAVSPALDAAEAPPSLHVRIADLDLRDPSGVAQLDRRIKSAARRVCSNRFTGDLQRRAEAIRCFRSAIAATADQRSSALAGAASRASLATAEAPKPTSSTN